MKPAINAKYSYFDFRSIGFGDCISGLVVIAYLAETERELLSEHSTVLVSRELEKLAQVILAGAPISVEPECTQTSRSLHRISNGRVLIPRAPRDAWELFRALLGKETFLNWAEGCQLEVAGAKLWNTWSYIRKTRFLVLQTLQFRMSDPRSAAPIYIGFRLLFSVFKQSPRTVTQHVLRCRGTYYSIRERVQCYVSSLDTRTSRVPQHYNGKIVLFPGAESFNAIPVDLCKAIEERFGSLVMFVLHKSDRAAQEAGEKLRNVFFVDNIDDTLLLIARNYPIAVDSFVSHLIQLITDEATIIFSREVRERFVHPGARPRTIEMTPECAPCEYVSMRKSAVCPIGRTTCVAFESLFPLLEREILLVQRNLEIKMVQRQTRHE